MLATLLELRMHLFVVFQVFLRYYLSFTHIYKLLQSTGLTRELAFGNLNDSSAQMYHSNIETFTKLFYIVAAVVSFALLVAGNRSILTFHHIQRLCTIKLGAATRY